MLQPTLDLPLALTAAFSIALLPFYVEALVKFLAVAGGAAVGGGATGFVGRRLGRTVARRDMPMPLVRALRVLGGLASGMAVWIMVFAPGGSGLWGGGGSLLGERGADLSTAQDVGRGGPADTSADTARVVRVTPPPPITGATIRVTMLGGPRVKEGRYYLIEGNDQPLTLPELKKAIKERQAKGAREIDLFIYENSVSRNHAAVRDLERWAQENDLSVRIPATKGDLPVS